MIFTTDKKKAGGGVNEHGILLILNIKLEIGLPHLTSQKVQGDPCDT
jgi:hypothetical protein